MIEKDIKFRLDKLYDDTKDEWYFEVQMIKRIQGTFFEKLELYHFPFDVQGIIKSASHYSLIFCNECHNKLINEKKTFQSRSHRIEPWTKYCSFRILAFWPKWPSLPRLTNTYGNFTIMWTSRCIRYAMICHSRSTCPKKSLSLFALIQRNHYLNYCVNK